MPDWCSSTPASAPPTTPPSPHASALSSRRDTRGLCWNRPWRPSNWSGNRILPARRALIVRRISISTMSEDCRTSPGTVHVHTRIDAARRRHGSAAAAAPATDVGPRIPVAQLHPRRLPWYGFEAVRGLDGIGRRRPDGPAVRAHPRSLRHRGQHRRRVAARLPATPTSMRARVKLAEPQMRTRAALFQLMVITERGKRRDNQDRLRALHADHPQIEMFCGHNPFEYLDLVERSGGTARGISPTRRWRPENRAAGSARAFETGRR